MRKMAKAMKVEIIARETMKPSSPTPNNLKLFKLSLIDQIFPPWHTPLLYFYVGNGDGYDDATISSRSQLLKVSLSKNLTRFYPLAGRIKDHLWIECDDEGVEFVEARINRRLSDFLQPPSPEELKIFLPITLQGGSADRLIYIQANFLNCGGMVIGVCISHKLADANTFTSFIQGWSSMARGFNEDNIVPLFNGASLFPPQVNDLKLPKFENLRGTSVQRRFIFTASKIATLKEKVASSSVPQPSSAEAIKVLIWKCAMAASRSNQTLFLCTDMVDLRKRFSPPLPKHSFGNLLGYFSTQTREKEIEMKNLVRNMRKNLQEFGVHDKKNFLGNRIEEIASLAKNDELHIFHFTTWCGLPFYDADFGWGKPIWVTIPLSGFPNVAVLKDTNSGDGVEAWVWLSEEDMTVFECDQEFLEFAIPNPSVLNYSFL